MTPPYLERSERSRPRAPNPGYGHFIPTLLLLLGLIFFFSSLPLVLRNVGYTTPADGELHGRAIDYRIEPDSLRVRLYEGGSPRGIIPVRDDRPWREYREGDLVPLLAHEGDARGRTPEVAHIAADFLSMWGGLVAFTTLSILFFAAALLGFLICRRRPFRSGRFPPSLPPGTRPPPLPSSSTP